MFESAELGHQTAEDVYEREIPALRAALLDVQYELAQAKKMPVILLISGVDGAGKGETVNLLNEWMDPRQISTFTFDKLSDEETQRPFMWRFWRALPPKGEIGIFFGSWYSAPIKQRCYGKIKKNALDNALEEIVRFERMLTDEGALLVKFWFHLSKEKQKERIRILQKNPKTCWRVSEQDLHHLKRYDKFRNIASHTLNATSTATAPWIVVEGFDANYRNLTTGKYILEALRQKLANDRKKPRKSAAPPLLKPIDNLQILARLDLALSLAEDRYETELEKYQRKLNLLTRHPCFQKISIILAFEGVDASGKGGSIRRITQAVDARIYDVIPIAAPNEEERIQPYLWRFWRHIPGKGRLTIFDRSWYGRVLVERVEGFCAEQDWMRAYAEINDFEVQLTSHDSLLLKFWLHISPDEQLRRFEERQRIAYKRFKITEDDWRNRDKWDAYQTAACDMIERTNSSEAPWILVEANDKYYTRIKILRSLCRHLEQRLEEKV